MTKTNGGFFSRIDISVHPTGGSAELLAAFSDGLFSMSANAGNSFTAVALPSGPTSSWARLAVDRVTTAPDVAYAFGAAGGNACLWRRAGTIWTRITSFPTLNVNQAWYDWYVAATPNNAAQVYLGAIDTLRGNLAGSTWTWTNITTQGSKSIHPDQHCLAFSPDNSNIIYAGNDGGIFRSANKRANWKALNEGLGITEIEYLASDPNTWKWLMAGAQDNGTIRYTGSTVWDHIADGDGGDCGVNQQSPNVVYHSYYNVSLERSNNKGDSWSALKSAQRAVAILPASRSVRIDGGDDGHSFASYENRQRALDYRCAWPRLSRSLFGYERHRRQHHFNRHESGCACCGCQLEPRELEQGTTRFAGLPLYKLHRRRSQQSATLLVDPVANRRRHGVSLGQRGRLVGQLHGGVAEHTVQLRGGRSGKLPKSLGCRGPRWFIKLWIWARVGRLFLTDCRMPWLSTCSSTSRTACLSAPLGIEGPGWWCLRSSATKRRIPWISSSGCSVSRQTAATVRRS